MSRKNKGIITGLLLVFTWTAGLMAQITHPEPGFIYDDSSLPRIDISIARADLDAMYADPWSDIEYRAQLSFTREGRTESFSDIGIRIRGNTSRSKDKKSFKLSFNTFQKGGEFHDLEKMNLNAEVNDPSMLRSKLSWTVFRKLGIPAARSNHVLLYINNEFYGVYINTEQIDECFVNSRFGTNDGNLYKCTWPADLEYISERPGDYIIGDDEDRVYDLRINKKWDDYGDLSAFISAIHKYSDARFMEEVELLMNVQQYLKIIAVEVMSANWDGYMGNKNNFYLYRDQVSGRMEYIAYDLDNTWGLDWLGVDWARQSIYDWDRGERPLYDKVMEQELYRKQYTGYVKELVAYISSDELEQELLRWRDQIGPWVSQDPYYSRDFGYSYSDFMNALTEGIPDKWWLPYGVLEYASLRAYTALDECIDSDAPPLISHARVDAAPAWIRVDWSVEDDQDGFSSSMHYRVDDGDWQTAGPAQPSITDPVSGTSTYVDSISVPEDAGSVEVYFTAKDNISQETRYPATAIQKSFPLAGGPLRINEFMASNNASVSDPYGEYDDWVEIYNPGPNRVWMGNLFLSDKMGSPDKYKFPLKYLEPEEHYLVWLDGQPEQGEDHASFKINSDGEKLRLSRWPSVGYSIMDSISFGSQESEVSMGRSEDGGLDWIVFYQATPGFPNLSTSVNESAANADETVAAMDELLIYPNPASDGVIYFSRTVSGVIYDLYGKAVMQIDNSSRADIPDFVPGIYLFWPKTGDPQRFIVAGSR